MVENVVASIRHAAFDGDVREKGGDISEDSLCIPSLNDGFAFIRIASEWMTEPPKPLRRSAKQLMLLIGERHHEVADGLCAPALGYPADRCGVLGRIGHGHVS